jgi:hypothetical protein
MKRALVEGSLWMGQWTEVTADAFEQLGCSVDVVYSNRKNGSIRARKLLNRLGLKRDRDPLRTYYHGEILERIQAHDYTYYVSVSGKLDARLLAAIRELAPQLRIIYWIGDPFVGNIRQRFDDLYGRIDELDALALAEPGVYQRLTGEGFRKIYYLPFGVSERYHGNLKFSTAEEERFRSEVSFVGTHTPQRAELIRYLNHRLGQEVRVWGRGWGGSGIKCRGRLSLEETLKVYACSKISLNVHQAGVEGGNMRYFEIPAVGGFQICDWKEGLPREDFGTRVVTFRTPEELGERISYYLEHEEERHAIRDELRAICFSRCTYRDRFASLLRALEATDGTGTIAPHDRREAP